MLPKRHLRIAAILVFCGQGYLTGTPAFAQQNESTPNSIAVPKALKFQDFTWSVLSPENAGFEVLMPGEPRQVSRQIALNADEKTTVQMYIVALDGGKTNVVVAYHDVQEDPQNDEQRNEILDGGIAGTLLRLIPSTLVAWDKAQDNEKEKIDRSKIDGYFARRFAYLGMQRGRQIAGHSQLMLDGKRVFQLSVIRTGKSPVNEALIQQFLSSFKVVKPSDK